MTDVRKDRDLLPEAGEEVNPVGEEKRPEVRKVIESVPELADYKKEYDRMSDDIKQRCTWEEIEKSLLANGSENLKLVQAMQNGGELAGIDEEGRAFFKDKGLTPVMYGYDEKDELLTIYNRDPEQMKRVKRWANYPEVREQVMKEGYTMFPYKDYPEEVNQAISHTGQPFFDGVDDLMPLYAWLDGGSDVEYVAHNGLYDEVKATKVWQRENPHDKPTGSKNLGVVRMLRLPKV